MVVGNGMVAKRFSSYETDNRFVIFASGISNSKTLNPVAYEREIKLLESTVESNKEKTFVYFSTCAMYDPVEKNARYVRHKIYIEQFIQSYCNRFHIFRVSHLVGVSDNPNTVLNFFIYHIINNINFDLWVNTSRNLVDIDDMFKIVSHILEQEEFLNQTVNIAAPLNYNVGEIIKAIEKMWNTEANYISISKGEPFLIDISLIQPIIEKLGISFGENYLEGLLKKYYPQKSVKGF